MTTIINNPDTSGSNSGGAGLIIALVIVIALAVLFFLYGLPAIRKGNGGTTVNVPDKVQVDVSKTNY